MASSSSNRPAGGVTVTVPAAMSTVGTIAETNGTRTSRSAERTTRRSCAGKWSTRTTSPTSAPSRMTRRPTSWKSYQASSSGSSSVGCSIQRIAFASDSAAERSATFSKKPTGWPLYQRNSVRVRLWPCHGEVAGTCSEKVAPGTKRRSGSSVNNSSLRAPLRPCALVSRPTRSRVDGEPGGSAFAVATIRRRCRRRRRARVDHRRATR